GDGEAAEVEGDHHGLAVDAVEVDVAGVRDAMPAAAVDAARRDALEERVFQAVAEGGDAPGVGDEVAAGQVAGGAEGGDAGDVFGAGTAVALVMPAEGLGGEARSLAHVEGADALRRVELVRAHAVEVGAELLDVDGN